MKLLVITQIMDKNDDLLGFMQDWVKALANEAESVTVIALKKGENSLPDNVEVLSLGKEDGSSRIIRIKRFYQYIFQKRNHYDAVFVHMNPIYVVLGGVFWRLMGKRISLWFAHYRVGLLLRFANLLTHAIITSTPYACGLKSKKIHVVGQGINTEKFGEEKRSYTGNARLLFLGRITPVKELEVLIDALGEMKDENWVLDVVGGPIESSKEYASAVKKQAKDLGIDKKIVWHGSVANEKTVEFYQKADFFINLTRSGSFDKTTLEAMSCGCIALASNTVFFEVFPKDLHTQLIYKQSDAHQLKEKLHAILNLSGEDKEKISNTMREIIVKNHSVDSLAKKIVKTLQV